MEHIREAILNYKNMNSSGAVLLTGDWGIGKTYYVKNKLIPGLKGEKHTCVLISLFGDSSLEIIKEKTLFAILNEQPGDNKKLLAKALSKIGDLANHIPLVNDKVQIGSLFKSACGHILKKIEINNTLIFFDDFERISSEIKKEDILGFINDLTENHGAKVILMANISKVEGSIKYKEKVLEKTLVYRPDIDSVFDSLITIYEQENKDFYNYLKKNKKFFIDSITKDPPISEKDSNIKEALTNLRILKFALEHWQSVFKIIKSSKTKASTKNNQLKNTWVFTLSSSVMHKVVPRFSPSNNKELEPLDPKELQDLGLDKFISDINVKSEEDKETKEVKAEYQDPLLDIIRRCFYQRTGLKYIFHPQILDFVLEGKTIEKKTFIDSLNKQFYSEKGETKESHQLLDRFIYQPFSFNEEEIRPSLNKLIDHLLKGEFDDVSSYINATSQVLEYANLLPMSEEDIINGTLQGLRKRGKSLGDISNIKLTLSHQHGYFDTPVKKELEKKVKDYLTELESDINDDYEAQAKDLFMKDVVKLHDFMNHQGDFGLKSKQPFLHKITEEEIKKSLANWSPKSIEYMTDILKERFEKNAFMSNVETEYVFLERLEKVIDKLPKDTYTDTLLKKDFLNTVKRVKGYSARLFNKN
ncbi:hypothetical protein [Roseivirga pacifica]|uniref:hypothetical protein n=1 Tax=Roseivirga pacifica TaxID=1267423 RepID=UPI002095D5B9|nr:hypothetical protein [Roseivirga pacifica]MCO6357395.1 hypothetical protein [Roseivirga pacifica]MCO6367890.1 hypothetical protein [Roseivirga pacifica]MCO6369628.1 hypothetical protein [Roseivirga pacifica]MCO6373482.1 hypothetical protein [Roseivirga pacifica]MCO6377262.1 hypothetical protein [Roseivirga pacifica]